MTETTTFTPERDAALSFTQRTLLIALGLLTVLRWLLGRALEMTPQEALIHEWGTRHLSLAGWEGGPGTAVLGSLGNVLFDGVFGVRFFAPVIAFAATVVLYRLIHSIAGEKEAAWSVTLLNLTPMFNHGAVYLRPEMLGGLFLLIGTACVWRALRRASPFDWNWFFAGASFGLGTLCWYGTIIGLLSTLILLATSRRWRRQLSRIGPWVMVAYCFFSLCPLLIWNVSHQFAGWHHYRETVLAGIHTSQPPLLMGKWALAVSPVLFLVMIWALLRALLQPARDDMQRFLATYAIVPIIGALLLSLGGGSSAAWLTPALPFLCGLAPAAWERAITTGLHRKLHLQWACVLPALLSTLITLNPLVLRAIGISIPNAQDPSSRWRGWQALSAQVLQIVELASPKAGNDAHGSPRLFLIAANEHLASQLNFHLPDTIPARWPAPAIPLIHLTESPSPQSAYHFWPGYTAMDGMQSFRGCTALFMDDHPTHQNPPARILKAFDTVTPLTVFTVSDPSGPLRTVKVYSCQNYQGLE